MKGLSIMGERGQIEVRKFWFNILLKQLVNIKNGVIDLLDLVLKHSIGDNYRNRAFKDLEN